VSLIGKSVQPAAGGDDSNIELTDAAELPQDAYFAFSIRAQSPTTFNRDESVEVATADDSSAAILTLAEGLTLENSQVAVATLNPTKAFGPSTFGPLKFRVSIKGATSDWQPLTTLVRLPTLKELKCPATPDLACKLVGERLFLLEAVSGDPEFTHAVSVPDGFVGDALPVPHPIAGPLYVKLRDNPRVVNATRLSVQQLPATAGEENRAAAGSTTSPTAGSASPTAGPPGPAPGAAEPAAGPPLMP
jgi:hypothetical protein